MCGGGVGLRDQGGSRAKRAVESRALGPCSKQIEFSNAEWVWGCRAQRALHLFATRTACSRTAQRALLAMQRMVAHRASRNALRTQHSAQRASCLVLSATHFVLRNAQCDLRATREGHYRARNASSIFTTQGGRCSQNHPSHYRSLRSLLVFSSPVLMRGRCRLFLRANGRPQGERRFEVQDDRKTAVPTSWGLNVLEHRIARQSE